MSGCDLACTQLVADGGDVVDDILAAGGVALHKVGSGWEGYELVAFACVVISGSRLWSLLYYCFASVEFEGGLL